MNLRGIIALSICLPSIARADDCSGLTDCWDQLLVALLVLAAIAVIVAIGWEIIAGGLFAEGALGAGALDLEGGALAEGGAASLIDEAGMSEATAAYGEDTYVLWHGEEARLAYQGQDGFNVLFRSDWSMALNDEWVAQGISERAPFLLTSEVGPETLVGTPEFDYSTVFSRELEQLFNAGYRPVYLEAVKLFVLVPP